MQPRIVVVGAGIAGLCAAIAFARRGYKVDIFEASQTLDEVGAGLQLSPNVTRLIHDLEIGDQLSAVMVEPPRLSLLSGIDLQTLCEIPAGGFARRRWDAAYGVIHRADLQKLLADAVNADALCTLHLDRSIVAESEPQLLALLTRAMGAEPDLVVGADGVWSAMRRMVPNAPSATFSGSIAWRGLLNPGDLPALKNPDHVNAFLAPDTHLVTYPLGHRGVVNAVAITPGKVTGRNWDNEGNVEELRALFGGWNKAILNALGNVSWRFWPLFEVRNTCYTAGRKTALIGDAAHAMTPHAAQGAAMAIEDACALAACFDAANGNTDDMMPMFDALRIPRIARVRKRGDFNKFAYHAKGPARIARNLILSMRTPETLASDLDWLYGYDATDLSQL
ncbi:FAD-dependent monooxygenase [Hoeflea sp. TYP-13]|uniref:FAD-dependent monooxygenase n=1 Tax=Hoeflea sp. TYP-13 TaxID=3230023 RepID=UPI0034C65B0C